MSIISVTNKKVSKIFIWIIDGVNLASLPMYIICVNSFIQIFIELTRVY
jgi:hypothetical protein